MTPDLDRLELLATAATPGPWLTGGRNEHGVVRSQTHGLVVSSPWTVTDRGDRDAAYIAACSPEAILPLIARARAAEEALGDDHSDPRYRPLMLAVRAADESFQVTGDAGTKTWLDAHFLPELAKHGLTIAALAQPEPIEGGEPK